MTTFRRDIWKILSVLATGAGICLTVSIECKDMIKAFTQQGDAIVALQKESDETKAVTNDNRVQIVEMQKAYAKLSTQVDRDAKDLESITPLFRYSHNIPQRKDISLTYNK
jgi:hypothetical protein